MSDDQTFDPDTNIYQGLPTVDIAMCQEKCPKSKLCRRHPDSGTIPDPLRQTWEKFNPFLCQAYWPLEHKPKKKTK
jgi:hypothetical protein